MILTLAPLRRESSENPLGERVADGRLSSSASSELDCARVTGSVDE